MSQKSICVLRALVLTIVLAISILTLQFHAGAQGLSSDAQVQAATADRVGIDQKLNQLAPLDTTFKDETGKDVKFGDYFKQRPVVLVMPFYRCAGTCLLEMEGMIKVANSVNHSIGKDYEVVVVSLDPRETSDLAAIKKRDYLRDYGRSGADRGLHCLTGTREQIQKLADGVGFRFYYDPRSGSPVHSTGLIVCTPSGKLSRYLLGVDFAPRDLNLALVEAGENRIGSFSEKFTLLCSQYDPRSGKYTIAVMRLLQVAGCATVLVLATYILSMIRMERNRKGPTHGPTASGDSA